MSLKSAPGGLFPRPRRHTHPLARIYQNRNLSFLSPEKAVDVRAIIRDIDERPAFDVFQRHGLALRFRQLPQRIADLAGVEQIPATLTALLSELRDQYVLGITPRRTSGKGSWHPVRVEVGGGLVSRTQDGYFEP